MNGFIMAPAHNKEGRCDATGAFHIGADIFQKVHKLPAWVKFENDETSKTSDTKGFLDIISKQAGNWDVYAYFGHANTNALASADVRGRKGATLLANTLRPKLKTGGVVLLYACMAGQPGGFADWLSQDLADKRITVYGHLPPKGHTFQNACMLRYPGGDWVVPRTSPLWGDWYRDFHSLGNDLWARFPWMTQDQIEAELTAPGGLMGRWEVGTKGNLWHETFFGDMSVVRTELDQKFQVVKRGRWKATKKQLTVDWYTGGTAVWPLGLSLNKQTVKLVNPTGQVLTHAKRIEPPNVNPQSLFKSMFNLKQSPLIKVK